MSQNKHLPELLSPAGSPEALEAAIAAGADAVYLGGNRFNARMNAHNFGRDALAEAVTHAHRMGARVYLTLNTLVWDRELPEALAAAYEAATAGVDALIMADLGAAALIRKAIPSLPLHASTQLSGHNARMGDMLVPFGFSRFVIARETSLADIRAAVRDNPLEVEVFIHGALCVSHSGQCLFSSIVGGRSGNRGECAQPCRLPYACAGCSCTGERVSSSRETNCRAGGKTLPSGSHARFDHRRDTRRGSAEAYPLSLKDLSLAAHVPALVDAGVASLKIEGRMKSPGYVSGVTAIWRRLLDEGRAATRDEIETLSDLFSRGGFTDGYQTGRINHTMMGTRSEADKDRTTIAERAALTVKHPPRLPVRMTLHVREEEPVTLTAEAPLYRQGACDPYMTGDKAIPARATVTVTGDVPLAATGAALAPDAAERQLARTGGTPYRLASVDVTTPAEGPALTVPPSALNGLRRAVTEALDHARMTAMPSPAAGMHDPGEADIPALIRTILSAEKPNTPPLDRTISRTARFRTETQITPYAATAFDHLYLPLGKPFPAHVPTEQRGVILPPVIFDHEAEAVCSALKEAFAAGIGHVLMGNIGHIPLVRKAAAGAAVTMHGDFRLNPANALSAARFCALGCRDLILAPELSIPRMRDIGRALTAAGHAGVTGAIVYGRLPLMLLEKCAIRELSADRDSHTVCHTVCARDAARLSDRMGKSFPILREDSPVLTVKVNGQGTGHRNTVYNALPLSMSDRADELMRAELSLHHFLFSIETPEEVDHIIEAYRTGRPIEGDVRRFPK